MTKVLILILLMANGVVGVHKIYNEHKLDCIIEDVIERKRLYLLRNVNSHLLRNGGPGEEKAILYLANARILDETVLEDLMRINKELISREDVNYLEGLKRWKRTNETLKHLIDLWCWRDGAIDLTIVSIATRTMNSENCKEIRPILVPEVDGVYLDHSGELLYRNNNRGFDLDQLEIQDGSLELYRLTGEVMRIKVECKNDWCYYY